MNTAVGTVMDRTVAVIGGSGFVGRAIVEMLAREGARVIVLCRNAERAKFLKTMGVVGQVTPVSGNALSDEDLERAMTSADSVVNLVGILAEGGSQRFATLQGELPGRMGALAAKLGVKHVVHVSAIGASAESRSVYARSKAAGEAALHAAFPDAVILRPSIIFGPRDSFFNRFAGMAMMTPGLPLPGSSPYGDAARAVLAVARRHHVDARAQHGQQRERLAGVAENEEDDRRRFGGGDAAEDEGPADDENEDADGDGAPAVQEPSHPAAQHGCGEQHATR